MVSKYTTSLAVFALGYIFSVMGLSQIGGLAFSMEGTKGVAYTCSCSSGFMLESG